MAYKFVTGLTIVLLAVIVTQGSIEKLCVVNDLDSGNATCHCDTLTELEDLYNATFEDNTELVFCDSQFDLAQSITIENCHNLSLRAGLGQEETIMNCSNGTGLSFVNVMDMAISGLTFFGCGKVYHSTSLNITTENSTLDSQAGIHIYNCTNVNIDYVKVMNSSGTGITIFDTDGTVEVTHSTFTNNRIQDSALPGGGGVYVEFTYCPPGIASKECESYQRKNKDSVYRFSDCMFMNNRATTIDTDRTSYYKAQGIEFHGLGRGGGLCIIFKGNAQNNDVTIDDCHFEGNGAIWGAGLFTSFQDSPQDNKIAVRNTCFVRNYCYINGGGGVDMGLLFYDNKTAQNNTMKFDNCNFTENTASYGGGVKIYSTQSNFDDLRNEMEFINCRWERNMAQYGSAVDIAPHVYDTLSGGYLPEPRFDNCQFIHNIVVKKTLPYGSAVTYKSTGKGALISTGISVRFIGETVFQDNNGTAMYMSSSSIHFAENSNVRFEGNSGFEGGAIALLGFSVLYVQDNSTLTFTNNKAESFGGAIIYRSSNKHDFSSSRSCFIEYAGVQPLENRSVSFTFSGNDAGIGINSFYGRTIFATTLRPCRRSCKQTSKVNEMCHENASREYTEFSCIGNFNFTGTYRENEISTSGVDFTWTGNKNATLLVTPGQKLDLPFEIKDDLCQKTFGLYHVSIPATNNTEHDKPVRVDSADSYISDKTVRLYGSPGSTASLQLATTGFREVSLSIDIEIRHCGPGYVTNTTQKGLIDCICSVHTINKKYFGVEKCDTDNRVAYVGRAQWIGYVNDTATEDSLESGNCPNAFCHIDHPAHVDTDYKLPSISSRDLLDEKICGSKRTGRLCGRCRHNLTTYFHSINYKCSIIKYCEFGILFYVLSELVPVTVLFLIITLFKIQLTSGALNGFILFVQVVDMMQVDANGYIKPQQWIVVLQKIYRFLYRMLNLEFFTLDELSFCIWERATTMDVVAIKYVTIIYALALVIITIIAMKLCDTKFMKYSPKGSIIHGLSAFFVICYAQCTKVTMLILVPSRIYGIGFRSIERAVFYQGDLPHLQGEHLKYAIPAIFFLMVFVILPPSLLLVYPLCYKVFALLRIEETRCIQLTCRVVPLEKMKPMFDSFQSCFKDNYRFMAGFYIFYRLTLHAPFIFTDSFTKFYVILEIELVLILTLQAIIYAYRTHWHNVLDILLFANLAIINAMTLHNYKRAKETSKNANYQREIDILSGVQTFLIYLPLVYVMCYIISTMLCEKKEHKVESSLYDDVTDTLAMVDYRELNTSFRESEQRQSNHTTQ